MIYIVPDTNILKISYKEKSDYTKFYMNKTFYELQSLMSAKDLKDSVELAIPQLVWDELRQHKYEGYIKTCDQAKDLFNCLGDYGKNEIYVTPDEYLKLLMKQMDYFIKYHDLNTIPICADHWFKCIIERAIMKKPPFEGKNKETDKGFKDVVIWYSLIGFAKEKVGEYVMVTNDNIFHTESKALQHEFYEETGSAICFCRNFEEVLRHIIGKSANKYIDSVDVNFETREILLKHSNTEYTAKIHYLQPKIFAVEDVLTFINSDIKRIYDDALAYWDDVDLGCGDENSFAGSMDYDVKYNQNGMISFLFKGDIYLGGPHGTPIQISRVYDLSTGNKLGLCELLGKDEDAIISMIYQKWELDRQARGDDVYWDDFKPVYNSIDDVKFYLDDRGIQIYFDIYDAACYADGFVEFMLVDKNEVIQKEPI